MKNAYCFILIALFFGCSNPKKKISQKQNAKDSATSKKEKPNGLVKSYTSDGKLSSAITYKDGIKDGISYAYFSNGQVNLELTYKNGKREGQSKRYYENGKLFQTTEYKNNDLNGYQKKYRENGVLISEMRFENDNPCIGLKEYLLDGSPKKDYPKIIITPKDELKERGRYTLKISLSAKAKNVKYYEGKLSSSGCIHDGLNYLRLIEKTGEGEIVYNLPPRGFLMQELNIVAAVKTLQGNTYIVQKTFNLSIEN